MPAWAVNLIIAFMVCLTIIVVVNILSDNGAFN
jgi:hypothetical protein